MLIILTKRVIYRFFYYHTYRDKVFAIGEIKNVDDPNSSYFEHSIVLLLNELRFCHTNARANKREKQI